MSSLTACVCATCGTQFTPSAEPPPACPVCEDERQYVPPSGQAWTTLDLLRSEHRLDLREEEPGLTGFGMTPSFAIGQRALLVQTPQGNVLWDCMALVDDAIVAEVSARGGLAGIAISHPHYYTTCVEWSAAFGDVPIHLHADDAEWVMRPDPRIEHWTGETLGLAGGLTLLRLGGHFDGGTVLHWPAGAGGAGALLAGDIVQVVPDAGWVSFMRSYPNLIPLPARAVERIVDALEPYAFDRLYGAWYGRVVASDAKQAVRRSAERYVRAIAVEA